MAFTVLSLAVRCAARTSGIPLGDLDSYTTDINRERDTETRRERQRNASHLEQESPPGWTIARASGNQAQDVAALG